MPAEVDGAWAREAWTGPAWAGAELSDTGQGDAVGDNRRRQGGAAQGQARSAVGATTRVARVLATALAALLAVVVATVARAAGSRRAPVRAATVLAGVVAWSWFEPGRFIARGDTYPFMRGGQGLLSTWSYLESGGGHVSADAARVAETAVARWVGAVGWLGGPTGAQRLWTALAVAGAAWGAARLAEAVTAGSWPGGTAHGAAHATVRWSVFVGAVLSVANPYMLAALPNVLVCWAAMLCGYGAAVLVELARGRRTSAWPLAAVAAGGSLVAANPALVAVVVVWLALVAVVAPLVVDGVPWARRSTGFHWVGQGPAMADGRATGSGKSGAGFHWVVDARAGGTLHGGSAADSSASGSSAAGAGRGAPRRGRRVWSPSQRSVAAWGAVAKVSPLAVAVSLWWIAAVAGAYGSNDGRATAAVSDVGAWSFVHRRAQLWNVMTLRSAWGWDLGAYRWTEDLDRWWWSPLAWGFPLAVLGGVAVMWRRRRRAGVAAGAAVAAIWLVSCGLWGAPGVVNSAAYRWVPGWYLLREPAHKLNVVLMPVAAACIAVLASQVGTWWERSRRPGRDGRANSVAVVGAVAVLCAAVVYPLPFWTGSATGATDRPAVPSGWTALGERLEGEPAGKVLVLPLDDFYQMGTTWGFYGADLVAQQTLGREVHAVRPGGYFSPPPALVAQLREVEHLLEAGDGRRATALARRLGASHVVVRNDLSAARSRRTVQVAGPASLDAALRASGDATEVVDQPGAGVLWRLDGRAPVLSTEALEVRGDDQLVAAVAAADPRPVASTEGAGAVRGARTVVAGAVRVNTGREELVSERGPVTVLRVPLGVRQWRARLVGGRVRLELDRISLDGGAGPVVADSAAWSLPAPAGAARLVVHSADGVAVVRDLSDVADVAVPVGAGATAEVTDTDGRVLWSGAAAGGEPVATVVDSDGSITVGAAGDGPVPSVGPWSELGNCHDVDGSGTTTVSARTEGRSMVLSARRGRACVHAALDGVATGLDYTVTVPARGGAAAACVWVKATSRCEGTLERGEDSVVVRFRGTGGPAVLYVYAGEGDTVTYGRPVLEVHPDEALVAVPATGTEVRPARTVDGRGRAQVSATGVDGVTLVSTDESWSPAWVAHQKGREVPVVRLDGWRTGVEVERDGVVEARWAGGMPVGALVVLGALAAAGAVAWGPLRRRRSGRAGGQAVPPGA